MALPTATAVAATTTKFIPRTTFPLLTSLPRSYFLGHHAAGLSKMKTMLNQIDLVLECRDYRTPLTSRNPLLEESLAGRPRIIVYTKKDLAIEPPSTHQPTNTAAAAASTSTTHHHESIIRNWHAPTQVHFHTSHSQSSTLSLLRTVKSFATDPARPFSPTGIRVLVAGMPNVGKSTLLNSLRAAGLGAGKKKGRAARTGADPGVTRRVGGLVKVVNGSDLDSQGDEVGGTEGGRVGTGLGARSEGVYVLDTPGVFMPYVPDQGAMLKLALVGSVKDGVVQPVTLADYLLFRLNGLGERGRWGGYLKYMTVGDCDDGNGGDGEGQPSNDIVKVLEAMARKTGRLGKGGVPDVEGTAVWMVKRWRQGELGRFVLDEVVEGGLEAWKDEERGRGGSMNQARKVEREARRERGRERRAVGG